MSSPRKRTGAKIGSAMQGLALKTRGFRHGRPCAGHPRRDAHRKLESIAPSGAEKRVEVLIPARRLTAWIPGTVRWETGKE